MIVLLHSSTTESTLARNLGKAEYSYYFVRKSFQRLLEPLGIQVAVANPRADVRALCRSAERRGHSCILFSFSPPQWTVTTLSCPTIPVFAWEYDTLPDEDYPDGYDSDWTRVLRKLGCAITHSEFTAEVVRNSLGSSFPIISVPAPLWDRFADLGRHPRAAPIATRLTVRGRLVDSRHVDLTRYDSVRRAAKGWAPLPQSAAAADSIHDVDLDGIVYTSVFNPYDGRKNWFDMIRAFCEVFRHTEDATLLLKLTHSDGRGGLSAMLEEMYKSAPFSCRLVLLDGYLDEVTYGALCQATTFTVNTSHGEGQCLPMMEFMSAGVPAVAPRHTGMRDYLCEDNAFLIRTSLEPFHWPQDPRRAFRTRRHRIDYASLCESYRESYRVAREHPQRYSAMAARSTESLAAHCSVASVRPRFERFVEERLAVSR